MIEEFRFHTSSALWLLLCIPVLAWLTYFWYQKANQKIYLFAPKIKNQTVAVSPNTILKFFALLFFIIALARPQANPILEEREEQSLDIMVLLDVSKSMAAEDIYPNRLQKSKRSIQTLLSGLRGDRVGLVAFAGSAILVSPLTSDYEIIKNFLFALSTESIENQGTNIGAAFQTAMDSFRRGSAKNLSSEEKSHVVILFSDGEMTTGETKDGIQQLKEKNIIFYSILVGDEKGAPIPLRDKEGTLQSYKRDPLGNTVLTKADKKNMNQIASSAGGQLFTSTINDSEIYAILESISNLNRSATKSNKNRIYSEYFYIPLLIGLILILISNWQLHFKIKKNREFLNLIGLFFFIFCLSTLHINKLFAAESNNLFFNGEKKKSDQALKNYSEEKYSSASDIYKSMLAENPQSQELAFNTATSLLKEGKIDQATSLFQEQKSFAPSAFNLAGSLAEQKKYNESIKEYASLIHNLSKNKNKTKSEQEILELAKKNIEFTQKKQQQEKQKDQKDNKNDEKTNEDKQKEKGKDNKEENKDSQSNKEDSKEKDKKDDKENKNDQEKKQDAKEPSPQKYDSQKRKKFKENENLSEQDAKQILEALKQQEQMLQKKFLYQREGDRKQKNTSGKDW